MDWKKINVPAGSKLLKVHNFTYIHKGVNYNLEIDEYSDGRCSGHGEQSIDKNFVIETVSASSVDDCLKQLVDKINSRG
jgi:hypothetical protein